MVSLPAFNGGHGSRGWGRTPPPSKGGPPDDKGDDGSGEEENEEDDADEETVSVTSSSQVSAGRVRPLKWNAGKENMKEGAGGPPEDPNEPSGGGSAGDGRRGPRGHRGQRGRTRPPGRDGRMGPMGLVGPRGFPGRDGLSTTGGPFTSTGLGIPPVFNANLSTIGMENSALSWGITESCDAVPTKCELEHGRALEHDCEESATAGSSFRAISRKYTTERV